MSGAGSPHAGQPDGQVNTSAFWNAIYEGEESPRWNIGIAPPLLHWLSDSGADPGRVLVPGCGYGHDAVLFAKHGFEVVAVDFAPLAIERARREYPDAGVDWRQVDILDLPRTEAASFDYIYEYTCMVAIHPSRRAEFVQVEKALLKPGGLLIGCFYNHGREGGPPFDITREQVLELYQQHFEIRKLEVSPHSIERRMGHELWAEFVK
jgi:SAM-dependent methyltransferase